MLESLHAELHRLAVRYMSRERRDHTLQPSALVNEAYVRLAGAPGGLWMDRIHFLAAASQVMRRVLIDHARQHETRKRRGGHKVELTEDMLTLDLDPASLLAVDAALTELAGWDARQSRIVELRFYAGLTIEEIAHTLGISARTVKREWSMARAWLLDRIEGRATDDG